VNKRNIAIISSIVLVIIGVVIVLLLTGNKKFEVEFDSSGGSSVVTQEVKKNETVTKPTDPTRNGYEFDGWYLDDELFDFATPITKNIKLVAKWSQTTINPVDEDQVVVTFDSNGGSTVSSITLDKDGKITAPTNPTRSGYKFVSWQLDGKDYDFDSKVEKSITLVAKWEKTSTNTNTNNNTNNNNNNNNNNNTPTTISVTGVSISRSSLSLNVGENSTLTAEVSPSNATNKTITWTSSNNSVATVDSTGKVTAIGAGTATITATADGKSSSCTVTVIRPVTHSVEWVKVEDSSMGQYMLYIKSSEGQYVSGVVTITTSAGKTSDVNITSSGKMYIKSAVSNAVVKSVD